MIRRLNLLRPTTHELTQIEIGKMIDSSSIEEFANFIDLYRDQIDTILLAVAASTNEKRPLYQFMRMTLQKFNVKPRAYRISTKIHETRLLNQALRELLIKLIDVSAAFRISVNFSNLGYYIETFHLDMAILLLAAGANPEAQLLPRSKIPGIPNCGQALLSIIRGLDIQFRRKYYIMLFRFGCKPEQPFTHYEEFMQLCTDKTLEGIQLGLALYHVDMGAWDHFSYESTCKFEAYLKKFYPEIAAGFYAARVGKLFNGLYVPAISNFELELIHSWNRAVQNSQLVLKLLAMCNHRQKNIADSHLAALPADILFLICHYLQSSVAVALLKFMQEHFAEFENKVKAKNGFIIHSKKSQSQTVSHQFSLFSGLGRARNYKASSGEYSTQAQKTLEKQRRKTSIACFKGGVFHSPLDEVRNWLLVKDSEAYRGISFRKLL